ncbi:hypothetical protein DE146DRAFT_336080 [Phaeosphaeria sp. MPI-PUGE-AT-0046c]|nr:hypothetical protein DE146DRAFT_336080 [Phaeosphaeria sp. MPI-PUGE-AT-0046c]
MLSALGKWTFTRLCGLCMRCVRVSGVVSSAPTSKRNMGGLADLSQWPAAKGTVLCLPRTLSRQKDRLCMGGKRTGDVKRWAYEPQRLVFCFWSGGSARIVHVRLGNLPVDLTAPQPYRRDALVDIFHTSSFGLQLHTVRHILLEQLRNL